MAEALEYILGHGGKLISLICGAVFLVNFTVWLVRRIFWN
jgi:hypothetical protein